ncbi:MAG TPA: tripartite tricarboxylate transporter substrate binding protein [Burkholderiales bacterium]|nr:tripartite tricarboxylate transporter substrate binding protein [Burkholderiales bacterium]
MAMKQCAWVMALAAMTSTAGAQGWTPQKNVELVVPNPPGGSNDKTARTVERILKANNLVSSTMTVVNKPGGGGSIAYTYVQQHAGDPHYLVVAGPALLTNHITGASKLRHSDLTPIAALFDDYTAFAVAAGASLKSGKDLIERLKKDPKSVTIGFSPLLGSHNHIAAGLLMKAIGGNARDLKVVAYKGSADAIPNLMGGHIDLVTTAVGNVAGHVTNGKLSVVAITATQRFTGPLANVPTWKEQGVDHVFGAWRAIFAPKGITPEQAAYWAGVLRKATEAPEWKQDLERNYWVNVFVSGGDFAKELERDYASMKAVLGDIGLAK